MTRTPVPGELLRAATQPGAETAATSAQPWRATNAARGLRAIDREMLRLDAEKRALVEQARQEIADAREALDAASGLLESIGAADGPEGVAQAIADYLMVGLDQVRINDPEAALDPDVVDVLWNDVVISGLVVAEQIIGDQALIDGAVTARALDIVSESGDGHSWRLDDNGFVGMHSASQEAMHLDSGGFRLWDTAGNLTARLNGIQNYLAGEFRTTLPGAGQGVVINTAVNNLPGVWFTESGTVNANSPGMGMTRAEGLWVQGMNSIRFTGGRAATYVSNTTNNGNGDRGPGQLALSVTRDPPTTVAIESLFTVREGFYTVTFHAIFTTRPSVRAFIQINRNAGTAARSALAEEDIATTAWTGWCNAGDRFDFISYWATSGTYTQGSTINVLYHGR